MIVRKHFALQTGYHAGTDTRYGITLALGYRIGKPRYRFVASLVWDLPKFVYASEDWALNEPGYVRGLPIGRQGVRSSAWTGRSMHLVGWSWFWRWSARRYD